MAAQSPTPESETLIHSGLLAASLVLALIAVVFLGWLSTEVLEGATLRLDNAVREGLHKFATPLVTDVMRTVTQFGSVPVELIGTPLVALSFWRIGWHRRAVFYLAMMSGAGIILSAMKLAFHRTRPEPYFNYPLPTSFSFPSGHALLSFCFYLGLAAMVTAHQRSPGRRILIWSIAALLTLAIGVSRIYLSVHYFTDVVAGYTAALVWTTGVAWTYQHLSRRRLRASSSESGETTVTRRTI